MRITTSAAAALLLAVTLAGCGGGSDGQSTTPTAEPTSTAPTTSEPAPEPTPEPEPDPEPDPEPTSGVQPTTPELEQPAIWPAPGVVFDDPEAAAADFVSSVLGVPANLGDFQQGDSRSGEIEVLPPPEASGAPVRSVLLMRQLGPDDGWFVLAAVSGTNTIESPESGSTVPAGPVEVAGEGRGFEGALVVEGFVAGEPTRLDQQLGQGGSMEQTQPYSVTLDLSDVPAGHTVLVLVRGGVGLETDPGEFSAIPVLVGEP